MANNQYLTFIALEDCEFSVIVGDPHMSRYYSVDNGNSWVSFLGGKTPLVTSGNTILWRGEGDSGYAGGFGLFSSTGRFIAEGNALSIGNFLNFRGCTNLVSAENLTFSSGTFQGYTFADCTSLVTPPPSVPDGGKGVFSGCTSLTSAPTIQNTTLDSECFKYMFKGCSSLTTIPSNCLPSQIMAMHCYDGMFEDCTSLVNVPSDLLQAPILCSGCYEAMFKGCTSLRIAPNLNYGERPIRYNQDGSIYRSMFENCTSLEKIPILNEKIGGFSNYQYTFKGCTSLTHATVNAYGGQSMFENCTSLSAVTCLGESPYWQDIYQWLKGVQSYGIFYRSPSTNWRRDDSGIPKGWEVADFGSGIYKKYHVAKEQYRLETGGTWTDTDPLVTEISGDPIARYATLSECMDEIPKVRWIPSGTTCVNGNKRQNNYKQVTEDGVHWVDSDPLEWSASTVIEYDSEECANTKYLTFVAQTDNVSYSFYPSYANVIQYSLDDGATWNNLSNGNSTPSVNNGEKVLFKASGLSVDSLRGIGTIRPSAAATVEGNVMSLAYGDDFSEQTTFPADIQFRRLFSGATNITSAENLILPPTAVSWRCYCEMFKGCSSLTTAPILSATTLVRECYAYMFDGCSSLNSVTCLAYNISAQDCIIGWLNGVASNGTFNKACGVTYWVQGSNIPNNWTISTDCGDSDIPIENRKVTLSLDDSNTTIIPCNNTNTITNDETKSYIPFINNIVFGSCAHIIGDSAFNGCTSLTSVSLPNGVSSIGNSAFANCTSLTSITIPDSVTTIWDYAFNTTSLRNVTIPNSITTIEHGAFGNCTSLTSITIPDSVTTIGWMAFYRCRNLSTIEIPESITLINSYSFGDCNVLNLIIHATTPPTFGTDILQNTSGGIYVPAESVDAYKAVANLSKYKNRIYPIPNS